MFDAAAKIALFEALLIDYMDACRLHAVVPMSVELIIEDCKRHQVDPVEALATLIDDLLAR